jgi:hypothetical protein
MRLIFFLFFFFLAGDTGGADIVSVCAATACPVLPSGTLFSVMPIYRSFRNQAGYRECSGLVK